MSTSWQFAACRQPKALLTSFGVKAKLVVRGVLLVEKRDEFSPRKKYFSVHQVAAMGVAKWNMEVFNRFNGDRFSVAACNNYFWLVRRRRRTEDFCNNGLEMRKNRGIRCGRSISHNVTVVAARQALRPTFSACFSDAGTNNGVEESLSNYSIEDLVAQQDAFPRRMTRETLCCSEPSAAACGLAAGT